LTKLRVMTFNLRGASYPQDAPNTWENRAGLNIRTIQKYAPDLIGFQELQAGNRATYQEQLRAYQALAGTPSNEPGFYNYNSIYWNPQRLALLESGGMYLSESPDAWSKSWDSVFVRSVNWARFRTIDNEGEAVGCEFYHFNTHLDHVGVQARVQGSRIIIQQALALSRASFPVIVTGDFNCIPWLPEYGSPDGGPFLDTGYALFRQHGFRDAFLEAGEIDSHSSHTYHGYEGEAFRGLLHGIAQRIDWILWRDDAHTLAPLGCQIVRDAEPPLYPSDHYPVIADLEWKPHME
jgi:endonuclease/exonuclease/phosphatase family metal-dependent hydrolase